MYETLAKIMNIIINNDEEDIDLKDRAVFYCKSFQDIAKLKRSLCNKENGFENFFEEGQLFKENSSLEFNTISVILEKATKKFLKSAEYMNIQREKELSKF